MAILPHSPEFLNSVAQRSFVPGRTPTQPRWGWRISSHTVPRVGRRSSGQPWANGQNPVGIQCRPRFIRRVRDNPRNDRPPVAKSESSNDASNSSPIPEEDRHRKFSMFSGPLHVGDAGFPYSFIVMSVQDEHHVLAAMRYGDAGGYDPGQEREIVWANIPTVGMASDHEFASQRTALNQTAGPL